ncbi:MAG: DegT/DnrJ/EryC1/StrS family aminotransferase [Verrucomicrobiaceae bacterium]
MKPIPLFDLQAQYLALKPQIDEAITTVIAESAFIRGRFVESFEKAYATDYGVKHCISCANGTDAIYIVLKQLGIGPGDEVLTTANSWIASSEVITQAGARVVFADVEDAYYTLDPAQVEAKITPRTKAIVAVHLLGQPADLERLQAICKKHNLHLIEDTAQAHYAEFNGQRVGTFGVAATFSFYPGKNLGAYGDAGAIITNDDDLAAKCRSYARHGSSPSDKHDHIMEGINSRLDGLQAAVLIAKLPHIHAWNVRRNELAKRYHQHFDGTAVKTPATRPGATHVFHAYVVRLPNRDAVKSRLAELKIGHTIHYPTPLPLLQAYRYLGHTAADFPVACLHKDEMLTLPLYPEMTEEQLDYVAKTVLEAVAKD